MADVCERKKIVREIEKTSESIRKKHCALKTGRIEENITLNRHFKPLIKPLRLFVDSVHATKRELRDDNVEFASKVRGRKRRRRRSKRREKK